MNQFIILLFVFGLGEPEVVSQQNCALLGASSLDEAKTRLLTEARRGAVGQLFGSLVTSLTQVEGLVLRKDQIQEVSLGLVRLEGSPHYYNGDNLGEICVKIRAYALDEDRAKLRPRRLSKKVCVAEGDVTTLAKRAEEKAILEALHDYDANLKQSATSILPLLHEVSYSEAGFIEDTTTFCTRVSGILYPIEAMALRAEGGSGSPSQMTKQGAVDLSGHWELALLPKKTISSNGSVTSLSGQYTMYIKLAQAGNTLAGSIVGADQSLCTQGAIIGTIQDDAIELDLRYQGSCCPGLEEVYQLKIDKSSAAGPVLRGKVAPKDRPSGDCFGWWADVVAYRRLL